MDDSSKSALNGAQKTGGGKANENENKEKVNRAMLLKQQIEENRSATLSKQHLIIFT